MFHALICKYNLLILPSTTLTHSANTSFHPCAATEDYDDVARKRSVKSNWWQVSVSLNALLLTNLMASYKNLFLLSFLEMMGGKDDSTPD